MRKKTNDPIQDQVQNIFNQKENGTLLFGRFPNIRAFHESHNIDAYHLHVFAFGTEKDHFVTCAIEKHEETPEIDAPIIVCTKRGWYEYTGEFNFKKLTKIIQKMHVIHYNEKSNADFFKNGLKKSESIIVSGNPKYLAEADLEYNMPYFYPRPMVMDQLVSIYKTDEIKSQPLYDHCLAVYFGDNDDVRMIFKKPLELNAEQEAEQAQEILEYYWDAFFEYIAFPQENKEFHDFKKGVNAI